MRLIQIAATGKNNELGFKGDMPWGHSMKEDLKFFQKTTRNHAMVMGRKTFESLPGLLKNRHHIVITTSNFIPQSDQVSVYSSLEDFYKDWKEKDEDVFVIGGASLYKSLMDESDELILTRLDQAFDADVYYPDIDPDIFELYKTEEPYEENGISCRRIWYRRKA